MKNIIIPALAAIAAAGFSAQGMAADDHAAHAGHGAMPAHANADVTLAEGLVKKIDKPAGKVTVSHGPLPNGMPAMTMAFAVKNAGWLDQMKAGDKIRFMPDQVNGVVTIVRFEKPK